MSKGDIFENDFLKLIFNATAIANVADNAATSPVTNLYVSLHTADVGEAGTQATNETSYTPYTRIGVARSASGWTVTNNSVVPVNAIQFAECTSGTATISHFAVGLPVVGTYSQSTTSITVTLAGHGLTTGQYVYLNFTSGTASNGAYVVTVTNSSTFTVTSGTSATTSGNVWLAGGPTKVLYKGQITPSIAINVGVTPRLTTSSTITED